MNDPHFSWRVWVLMNNFEFHFLPYGGGLLDQPEWLIDDLLTISGRKRALGELMEGVPASLSPYVRKR